MAGTLVAHMVTCNRCGARAVVMDGVNVHDTLACGCCGSGHRHGDPQTQETVRPPCRSVTVSGNAVVVPALGG